MNAKREALSHSLKREKNLSLRRSRSSDFDFFAFFAGVASKKTKKGENSEQRSCSEFEPMQEWLENLSKAQSAVAQILAILKAYGLQNSVQG